MSFGRVVSMLLAEAKNAWGQRKYHRGLALYMVAELKAEHEIPITNRR